MEYIVLSCLRGSSRQGSFRDFTQSDVFRVFSEAPIGGLLIVRARVGDGACRRYPYVKLCRIPLYCNNFSSSD